MYNIIPEGTMSERIVFNDLRVDVTAEDIAPRFGKRAAKLDMDGYASVLREVARPKAILRWADTEVLDNRHVNIAGHVFESFVLADKLKDLHRVILYVATAGNEIKDCDRIRPEVAKDILSGVALMKGNREVRRYLSEEMGMTGLGALNPGSLPDWPIENNHALCDLIGDVGEIGITLNEKGYMLPWNSSSGILFSGADGYMNCSLCTKLDCIGRRAPFNKEEYIRLFRQKTDQNK